jgi:hypothetical protein
MTPNEWAAVITCIIGVMAAVYSAARLMVKSILREFQPNGGSSLKDQVNRIETRLDALYTKLID